MAAGAGVPLVEFEEDKKTRVKVRSEKSVSWADFREMVLDAIEDTIVGLTDTYCGAKNPQAWQLEALSREVKAAFNLDMLFTVERGVEGIQDDIYKLAEKTFSEREAEYKEDWHRFCQLRYLATIDQLWKDHLLSMDHLRQGIGLRGYGQKDPKIEYKKEGYSGFIRMLGAIKVQVVTQIMRAQPRDANADAERLQRIMAEQAARAVVARPAEDGKAEPVAHAPKTVVREGPKLGRNDPCHCGSGKKYKKCHGAAEAA